MKQGWEMKRLNDVSENLDNRRVPITKNVRNEGSIPYYGASGIVDYVADYLFNEDLLCVSEDGANLLARTYPIAFSISGKTWVNNHAHVLKFKNSTTQKFVEIYLNSMDRDGTGQGYDLSLLDFLPKSITKPVILAGGVGNANHLAFGLADPRVDAAATANLFNFVGNGLQKARQSLISNGVDLPLWDIKLLEQHLNVETVGI